MHFLGEADDRFGGVTDQHVVLVRDAGLVEHAHDRLEHAHAGIAMEVAEIVAVEELRDVLG